jgi:hypothetical protein
VKYIPFTISVITHADDKGKDNYRIGRTLRANFFAENALYFLIKLAGYIFGFYWLFHNSCVPGYFADARV